MASRVPSAVGGRSASAAAASRRRALPGRRLLGRALLGLLALAGRALGPLGERALHFGDHVAVRLGVGDAHRLVVERKALGRKESNVTSKRKSET